jgi:hypothetical protein
MTWSPGQTIDLIEKQAIEGALRYHHGNKTRTAEALGIAIRTLDNKLAIYKEQAEAHELQLATEKAERMRQLERARGITPTGPRPPDTDEHDKGMNLLALREAAKAAKRSKAMQK